MIVDPQLPYSLWQMGKVVKVFPGPDNHVRSTEVQIKDKVYTRPNVHLIVLPKIPDDTRVDNDCRLMFHGLSRRAHLFPNVGAAVFERTRTATEYCTRAHANLLFTSLL